MKIRGPPPDVDQVETKEPAVLACDEHRDPDLRGHLAAVEHQSRSRPSVAATWFRGRRYTVGVGGTGGMAEVSSCDPSSAQTTRASFWSGLSCGGVTTPRAPVLGAKADMVEDHLGHLAGGDRHVAEPLDHEELAHDRHGTHHTRAYRPAIDLRRSEVVRWGGSYRTTASHVFDGIAGRGCASRAAHHSQRLDRAQTAARNRRGCGDRADQRLRIVVGAA